MSARFWLMDCRNVQEVTKMATTLYKEVIHVPFMAKYVVFSKRHEQLEARMRVFCMTDDKEEKTLEQQVGVPTFFWIILAINRGAIFK